MRKVSISIALIVAVILAFNLSSCDVKKDSTGSGGLVDFSHTSIAFNTRCEEG